MNRMANLQTKCINSILDLFKTYENNDYMIQRIHNHIVNYLPNTLSSECKNYERRIDRNNYLTNEQHIFIQVFLSKNKYFYLPNNNLFYEYNGINYSIVKEDDIIHKLLSSISKERILLQWKHKTKINIIKQIKERTLFSSIPESETIQNVLNVLYPSIFFSKNSAKYFLTVIGDNILKKNTNLIFLVNNKMKKFLFELDNIAFATIGNTSSTHNFMTKYHENHFYENCRLIKINENYSNNVWRDFFKKIGLDLICVATHYSTRYENSDKFIETKSDEELKTYAYYIKNTSQKNIVDDFCNKYIVKNNLPASKMEWKNVHFVWKQFLSNNSLPNMIYSSSLKSLLKEYFNYDEQIDSFIGITSMYLPIQTDFIKFWETTITVNNLETEHIFIQDTEFEIDELCYMFKIWAKQTNEPIMTNGTISEENVIKIIKHFYPLIGIIEEKYILNISSSIWDKEADINKSFEHIKKNIKENYSNVPLISFDDAYNCYYKYCNTNSYRFIVSKRYFEKYLYLKLSDYIVYDKFIETKWILDN